MPLRASRMQSRILTQTASLPPAWALQRPKSFGRQLWDLFGAPARMILLPDDYSERCGLTSLRAERMAAVLPELRGRVLDVGAGDNLLVKLYRQRAIELGQSVEDATASVGIDVVDWHAGCTIVPSADKLPFSDMSFDTVCFVACINHIPEREGALIEARRLLRPGGRTVITMIGRWIGNVGHKLWWYSEDKHRNVAEGELMGMDRREVCDLLRRTGFTDIDVKSFVYGMNLLYIARPEGQGFACAA